MKGTSIFYVLVGFSTFTYVGKQHQFFQIVGSAFLKPMNTDIFEVGKTTFN
jgi:hypothetical protein